VGSSEFLVINKADNLVMPSAKCGISHINGSAKNDLYHTCHRFTSKKPTNNKITAGGNWSLVIGHWSLVIGHWSLVIGHWSLDISEKESKTLNLSRRKPNFWRCLLVIGQLGQLILSPCSLPPALTAIGYFLFASH
jgi:hypothetical protein